MNGEVSNWRRMSICSSAAVCLARSSSAMAELSLQAQRSTVRNLSLKGDYDALDFDLEFLEATELSAHDLSECNSELPFNPIKAGV